MYFPKLNAPRQSRVTVNRFPGLDRRPRGQEGSFREMENLCAQGYPTLTVRRPRGIAGSVTAPGGLTAKDGLIWVDGHTLYVNGSAAGLMLSEGKKQLVSMGAWLLIWPDKLYINTKDLTDFGSLENKRVTEGEVSFTLCRPDGTAYSGYLAADTAPEEPESGSLWLDTGGEKTALRQYGQDGWTEVDDVCVGLHAAGIGVGFRAGDGVSVSGCREEALNGSFQLRAAEEDCLVVTALPGGLSSQTEPVTVERSVPDMDYVVESGNRLWGCKYGIVDGQAVNAVYASKLGDFRNWNCFAGLSTDSYAASRGSDGKFTGAADYLGSPLFFKENCVERVYPSANGTHQIVTVQCPGVKDGSGGSLQVVDGKLYYHSQGGVCVFDGSMPVNVSQALGEARYHDGVAGAAEGCYYLSAADEAGAWHLLVLDTRQGLWYREDGVEALGFAPWGGDLYCLTAEGQLLAMKGAGETHEGPVQWMAETGELKLSKAAVDDWVEDIGLTAQQVYNDVVNSCPDLMLPDIDIESLRSYGVMSKGKAPDPWARSGNAWCDGCEGKRRTNRAALEGELPSFLPGNATDDSLIGRTFRKLCDIARNPGMGPYYAAYLLSCNGYDLKAAVDGAIREMEENKKTQKMYLDGAEDRIVQASTDFCAKRVFGIGDKRAYNDYMEAVRDYFRTYNRVRECTDVVGALQKFREQMDRLNGQYYALLTEVLDNLLETFEADEEWLGSPAASAPTAYTERILQLSDIRPRLDRAIRTLNAKQLVQDFTEYLMKAPEEWSTRDDGKIGLYISEFMVKIFKEQTDRSLEDYLYEKYPAAGHNSALLAKEVNRNILGSVYNGAKPMFWCNPAFNKDTFDSSSLSVPANASAVCDAAEQFGSSHTQFYIRKTGLKNRIFALRFCSGIPFYAYAGISQLKAIYDNNTTTQYGVGAHLYTNTGRGQDDSGFHDWRNFLPVPMPYSYSPDLVDHAQELLALYDEGVKKQIIYTSDGQNYFIRQSAPQAMSEYKPEDFMANWQLDAGRLQKERKRLQDLLSGMYDPANGGRLVSLKNDGFKNDGTDVVNRVRKDYFMHYPMLQRIVRQELEKQEKIRRAMEQLDQIEKELTQYEADMTTFTNMVFYGMIECLSATGEPEYDRINKAFYKYRDRRGMETEKILVEDSKAFRFGKKYPLYEMFRSYRAMEPDEEPRQEMDEREAELRKQTRGANDHLIAASLEKRWNAKALQQLVRDTANETDEDKAEIRRFYEELVSRILGYKDVFTDEQWTRTSKVASNPAPAARTWTVSPGGSTSYTVYSDRSLQMAWDAVNNTWVPLTAGMWVLNKAGDDWDPIQLDAAGNIING